MENGQIREVEEKKKKKKRVGGGAKQPPPLKVVYISNPMKLNTSPSNFRSLVQELTGQHAVWPVDPSKFSSSSSSYYNSNNNMSVVASDVSGSIPNNTDIILGIGKKDSGGGGGGGGGTEFSTAEPSPEISAGSSNLSYLQHQDGCDDDDDDDDDRVVLIDHHMLNYMVDDHNYFSGFVNSGSCNNF